MEFKTNVPVVPSCQFKVQEDVWSETVDHVVLAFLLNVPKNREGHFMLVFGCYRDCSCTTLMQIELQFGIVLFSLPAERG